MIWIDAKQQQSLKQRAAQHQLLFDAMPQRRFEKSLGRSTELPLIVCSLSPLSSLMMLLAVIVKST